jgi:carboxymethylenebutenolidase
MSGFETVIPGGDGAPDARAYAALPAGAKRGMVVLPEVYGRQPEIDRVVERFAGAGYAAVEPDLFSTGPKPICIVRCMRAVATGEGVAAEQVRRATAWLRGKTGLPDEKIGVIGFCLGGGFALAIGRGYGAVSTNYGALPKDELLRGLPPVIGCYGGRDQILGNKGPVLEARLRSLGIPVETHTFPEVGHSFLTDGHHPIGDRVNQVLMGWVPYNPTVAEEAWRRILAFFDTHLPA